MSTDKESSPSTGGKEEKNEEEEMILKHPHMGDDSSKTYAIGRGFLFLIIGLLLLTMNYFPLSPFLPNMSNAELGNMYSKFRKPKNQSTGPTTTHSWRDNASYNEGTRDFLASAKHYQCPPSRLYTRAEVALHNRSDDLWVVIFGNVLDVTSFVKRHPGGSVLLDGAGGHEMGTVFAQFHHPSTVGLFASFCIGRIVP